MVNRINHNSTNAQNTAILHTAEDPETLVRSIIQLSVVPVAAGVTAIGLMVQPNGVAVGGIGTAEVLDQPAARQVMMIHTVGIVAPGQIPVSIDLDLRGMRKLQPEDEIVLVDLSDAVDTSTIVGTVTLFFKE